MRALALCLMTATLFAAAAAPAPAQPGASLPPPLVLPAATPGNRRAVLQAMYDQGVRILDYTERTPPNDRIVVTEVQATNQWFEACSDWIAANLPPGALADFTHLPGATYLYDMNTLHTPEAEINNASIQSGMPRYLENLKGLMAREAGR
jgi:hypothetical protein